MPDISLIISVYNRIDALGLIFQALSKQTFKDFEVIVAEDNDSKEMEEFIYLQKRKYPLTVKHVSQHDNGFRKNKILNDAIKNSDSNYLVFIDGDCIPQRHFLEQYHLLLKEKLCLFGRRVMLSESLTNKLLNSQDLNQITWFNLFTSGSKRLEDGLYIPNSFTPKKREKGMWGCNFGLLKQHMLDINGFDEDYTSANVGEDEDVEWRLRKTGVEFKRIKSRVVLYHLHHATHYSSDDYRSNYAMMMRKIEYGKFYCKNGIAKTIL